MKLVDYISKNEEIDQTVINKYFEDIKLNFDYKYQQFSLPSDLKLFMVDVNSGSDTKVLVSAVLKWE